MSDPTPTCRPLSWRADDVPAEFHDYLDLLGECWPIRRDGEGLAIRVDAEGVEDARDLCVRRTGEGATISCSARNALGRGLSTLMAGGVEEGGQLRQRLGFQTLGIMLDNSRNAVMRPDYVRRWLAQISLMGYNLAMLYTEDTYLLDGEPLFGYQRGAFSKAELREIDDWADRLGIELVPCIQTLGHMEQVLKWLDYGPVKDNDTVLLIDEPKTYELIEKMLSHCAEVFRSRRVHVGMDEAHGVGRGTFLKRFGYQKPYDILNRHLRKVLDLCEDKGLEAMMWSDMFFRIASATGRYYDLEAEIPEEVARDVPEQADLVYWDYYHSEQSHYEEMIRRHQRFGGRTIMGSGVWTWGATPWYHRAKSERFINPCVRACRKMEVDELFFTLWGDDGAFCEFDSALAGLAYAAEHSWGVDEPSETMKKRFAAICGAAYDDIIDGAAVNDPLEAMLWLWDDPLLALAWKHYGQREGFSWEQAGQTYRDLRERLASLAGRTGAPDFGHLYALTDVLAEKVEVRFVLEKAYASRDRGALAELADRLETTCGKVERLQATFRRQWLRRNRPQGLEVIQGRIAVLQQRYRELQRRLRELLAGEIEAIAELDEPDVKLPHPGFNWREVSTASWIH